MVSLATYHVRDVRDFFKRNQWLYVSEDDLTTIRDRLRKEIGKRKNPLFMDLGGDDEPVDELRRRLTSRDPLGGRFPDGVLSDKDGRYVWIAALPPGGFFGERAGEKLHHAAEQLIRDNNPAAFHPEMKAEVLGPVATLIANRQAIERDILWVTVTCVVVVALSHPAVLPALAGGPADRRPGGHRHGDGLRRWPSWRSATSTRRRRSWVRSSSATASTTPSS